MPMKPFAVRCLSAPPFHLIFLIVRLRSVSAQDAKTPYQIFCETRLPCCKVIKEESLRSCLEFSQYGFTEVSCRQWAESVDIACKDRCSNCTQMGVVTKAQCKFFLQTKSLAQKLIETQCTDAADIMEKSRCPTNCDLKKLECYTADAKECMAMCGNYQGCYGRKRRGTLQPDEYEGVTQLQGLVRDPEDADTGSTVHSCDRMPRDCMHHRLNSKCARYKSCELDLCLVKDITCTSTDPCRDIGSCLPSSGQCLFRHRPNGDQCSDGLAYTTGDQCIEGKCTGTPNECLKYNITCQPPGQCIGPGRCMSHTGRCIHEQLPDGTLCDDGKAHTGEDKCISGLCHGRVLNTCADEACEALDQCHLPGVCDGVTGSCSHVFVPNEIKLPCEDGDPETSGDICIDGICVGNRFATPKYQMLGSGDCVDVKSRRMHQYCGDVLSEEVCRQTCSDDPSCLAYSYSFPMCRLYGTVRKSAPRGNWVFQRGDTPSATDIQTATGDLPGARGALCWKKAGTGNALVEPSALDVEVNTLFEPLSMAGLFTLITLCTAGFPLLYKWKKEGFDIVTPVRPLNVGEDASLQQNALKNEPDIAEDRPPLPGAVPKQAWAPPSPPKQTALTNVPLPEGQPPK